MRQKNVCADALAALGSKLRDKVKRTILIHRIEVPIINLSEEKVLIIAPFIDHLADNKLPPGKWAARRLKARSTKYVVIDGYLHRWTTTKVFPRCITGDEIRLVMAEKHKGTAGNHSGGPALALKIRNLRFFWPTMNTDCESYAKYCDMCQHHAPNIHRPTEFLRTTTAPYPFRRWGMDVIEPMPASRQCRFVLVLTDYFTKMIEADSFACEQTEKSKTSCGKHHMSPWVAIRDRHR
ncbi:hypothetical protein N665_0024s0013 [Sinapis alba]|nr:hypothetical protein N665_0024s0013 [Sinapis alba]